MIFKEVHYKTCNFKRIVLRFISLMKSIYLVLLFVLKFRNMKKLVLLICTGLIIPFANSQSKIVDFLVGGKADANVLVQGYLNPYARALGDGLNNGWYNSASTHKFFGFDLSVSVSAIQIPESGKTFDLNAIGLTKLKPENTAFHIAPTIAGEDKEGPTLLVPDLDGNTISTVNTPNGLGFDMVPVPMAQFTFGLLPHTDVMFRYVPEMKYDNNGDEMKLGFWGFGVKNNFKKWIPFLKSLPFDASVFGSFSNLNAQSEISFDPNSFSEGNVNVTFGESTLQQLQLDTKTTKYGLILSKKLSVLTVFGGIGKSTSETTIALIGDYVIETTFQKNGLTFVDKNELKDPIDLNFKSSNVSLDAGIRLKLGFLSLFGSINKAEYVSYNTGISMGIR
jgi:hypothetical protein